MKKTLFCLFICIILSNCDVKPQNVVAGDVVLNEIYGGGSINMNVQHVDGIEYHVYYMGNGYEDGSVFVVNHTKELLEVEKLRKELNK